MCYTLNSDKLLLNFFANTHKRDITIRELNELADRLARACNRGIVVQIDRDSISTALLRRSSAFSMRGHVIHLLDENDISLSHIEVINRSIPDAVREECIRVCSEYGRKQIP